MRWLGFAMISLVFWGCQGNESSEYYGRLLDSPGGLTLEESEHPLGWGRPNCFTCHALENIHRTREERTDPFDMAAIQEQVLREGVSSCSSCHGSNGVTP